MITKTKQEIIDLIESTIKINNNRISPDKTTGAMLRRVLLEMVNTIYEGCEDSGGGELEIIPFIIQNLSVNTTLFKQTKRLITSITLDSIDPAKQPETYIMRYKKVGVPGWESTNPSITTVYSTGSDKTISTNLPDTLEGTFEVQFYGVDKIGGISNILSSQFSIGSETNSINLKRTDGLHSLNHLFSWTDENNNLGVSRWRFQYTINASNNQDWSTLESNTIVDNDAELNLLFSENGVYRFRVIALGDNNEPKGDWSNTVTYTVQDIDSPTTPETLTLVPGNAQIAASWSESENNSATEYRVEWDLNSKPEGIWDLTNFHITTELDYIIPALTNGEEYKVRVFASDLNQVNRNLVSVGPGTATPSSQALFVGAPENLTAPSNLISNDSIFLDWNAPSGPGSLVPSYYNIKWTDSQGNVFSGNSGSTTSNTAVTVLDLYPETWTLEVRSVNTESGQTLVSNWASVTASIVDNIAPESGVALTATGNVNLDIECEWNTAQDSSGISHYNLQYRELGETVWNTTLNINTLSNTIDVGVAGTYQVQLLAEDNSGNIGIVAGPVNVILKEIKDNRVYWGYHVSDTSIQQPSFYEQVDADSDGVIIDVSNFKLRRQDVNIVDPNTTEVLSETLDSSMSGWYHYIAVPQKLSLLDTYNVTDTVTIYDRDDSTAVDNSGNEYTVITKTINSIVYTIFYRLESNIITNRDFNFTLGNLDQIAPEVSTLSLSINNDRVSIDASWPQVLEANILGYNLYWREKASVNPTYTKIVIEGETNITYNLRDLLLDTTYQVYITTRKQVVGGELESEPSNIEELRLSNNNYTIYYGQTDLTPETQKSSFDWTAVFNSVDLAVQNNQTITSNVSHTDSISRNENSYSNPYYLDNSTLLATKKEVELDANINDIGLHYYLKGENSIPERSGFFTAIPSAVRLVSLSMGVGSIVNEAGNPAPVNGTEFKEGEKSLQEIYYSNNGDINRFHIDDSNELEQKDFYITRTIRGVEYDIYWTDTSISDNNVSIGAGDDKFYSIRTQRVDESSSVHYSSPVSTFTVTGNSITTIDMSWTHPGYVLGNTREVGWYRIEKISKDSLQSIGEIPGENDPRWELFIQEDGLEFNGGFTDLDNYIFQIRAISKSRTFSPRALVQNTKYETSAYPGNCYTLRYNELNVDFLRVRYFTAGIAPGQPGDTSTITISKSGGSTVIDYITPYPEEELSNGISSSNPRESDWKYIPICSRSTPQYSFSENDNSGWSEFGVSTSDDFLLTSGAGTCENNTGCSLVADPSDNIMPENFIDITAVRVADLPAIEVAWNHTSTPWLEGYKVKYKVTGDVNFIESSLISRDINTYTINGLAYGNSYDVKVSAINYNDNTVESSSVITELTTGASSSKIYYGNYIPGTILNTSDWEQLFQNIDNSNNFIDNNDFYVHGKEVSNNNFDVLVKDYGKEGRNTQFIAIPQTNVDLVSFSCRYSGKGLVKDYINIYSNEGNINLFNNNPGNTSTVTISSRGVTYDLYTIDLENNLFDLDSKLEPEVSLTVMLSSKSINNTYTGAPILDLASAPNTNQIQVDWTAPNDVSLIGQEYYYELEMAPINSDNWEVVGRTQSLSYTVNLSKTQTDASSYEFRVRVWSTAKNYSAWSNELAATFTETALNGNCYTVKFDKANADIVNYSIMYYPAGGLNTVTKTLNEFIAVDSEVYGYIPLCSREAPLLITDGGSPSQFPNNNSNIDLLNSETTCTGPGQCTVTLF